MSHLRLVVRVTSGGSGITDTWIKPLSAAVRIPPDSDSRVPDANAASIEPVDIIHNHHLPLGLILQLPVRNQLVFQWDVALPGHSPRLDEHRQRLARIHGPAHDALRIETRQHGDAQSAGTRGNKCKILDPHVSPSLTRTQPALVSLGGCAMSSTCYFLEEKNYGDIGRFLCAGNILVIVKVFLQNMSGHKQRRLFEMASSWTSSEFIDKVASGRGWGLRRSFWSDTWTLSGAENDLEWTCILTPRSGSDDEESASSIDWVCPSFAITDEKVRQLMSDITVVAESIGSGVIPDITPPPTLSASWSGGGPLTEIGCLIECLKSLSLKPLFSVPEYLLDIDDSAGILDDELRQRIENWPPAFTGSSNTQPFRLGTIRVEAEGLRIVTSDWWDSEAALEHQIQLGIDLAVRLHRAQTSYESARRVGSARRGGPGP